MLKGSFTDGNFLKVSAGDEVEYRFGARRGELIDALQDGDAFVFFFDLKRYETVKWINLCKVPNGFKTSDPPRPLGSLVINEPIRNNDWLVV